jgi:8-oxo-dGTP diphosphatase
MTLRSMASITIIDSGKILLLRKQTPYHDRPLWIPGAGGHFEEAELNDPDACLWREVEEEIGLKSDAFKGVRLRYIAFRRDGEQIRINYYYFGALRAGVSRDITNNEGELRWFGAEEARKLDMPLSYSVCLKHYLDAGCNDDEVYVAVGSVDESGEVVHNIIPMRAY